MATSPSRRSDRKRKKTDAYIPNSVSYQGGMNAAAVNDHEDYEDFADTSEDDYEQSDIEGKSDDDDDYDDERSPGNQEPPQKKAVTGKLKNDADYEQSDAEGEPGDEDFEQFAHKVHRGEVSRRGKWIQAEELLFLIGCDKLGASNVKGIASRYVITRDLVTVSKKKFNFTKSGKNLSSLLHTLAHHFGIDMNNDDDVLKSVELLKQECILSLFENSTTQREPRVRENPKCVIQGCNKEATGAHGHCIRHSSKEEKPQCSVEGCTKQPQGGGKCIGHGGKGNTCPEPGCKKKSSYYCADHAPAHEVTSPHKCPKILNCLKCTNRRRKRSGGLCGPCHKEVIDAIKPHTVSALACVYEV